MIKKYRTKPVVKEAVEWVGVFQVFVPWIQELKSLPFCLNSENKLSINTLEGKMVADFGDYIIRGLNNEFYPCKPDIFLKTYEEVVSD